MEPLAIVNMHLKQTLLTVIGWTAWASLMMAQQPASEPRPQSISVVLIGQVAQHLYDLGVEDGSVVVDNSAGMKKYKEFGRLRELVQNDWKTVVTEVIATDPDSVTRALLLVSAHALPPDSYRDFLDRMIDLAETGKIEKREMKWAIFPRNPTLAGVWSESWNDGQTRRAVGRVRKLFSDDPNMTSYCARLLSGELQQEAIITRKAMRNPEFSSVDKSPSSNIEVEHSSNMLKNSGVPSVLTAQQTTTPWFVVGVMIVAAIGLLWLLFKGRN